MVSKAYLCPYILIMRVGYFAKTLFIFYFLTRLSNVYGQHFTSEADSLFKLIKIEKQDTVKINLLLQLAEKIYKQHPQKSQLLLDEALALAEESNAGKLLIKVYNIRGKIYFAQKKHGLALANTRKGLELAKRLDEHIYVAELYTTMSKVYLDRYNYEKALHYQLKALKLYEKDPNKKNLIIAYRRMAIIHRSILNNEKVLMYQRKALNLAKHIGDTSLISSIYNDLGGTYSFMKNYNKALECFFRSLQLTNPLDTFLLGRAYNNIADTYVQLKNYDKALVYLDKSLDMLSVPPHDVILSYPLSTKAFIYIQQGRYAQAIPILKKTIALASLYDDKYVQFSNYQLISEAYSGLKNHDQAYKFLLKYSVLKDSVFNLEKAKSLQELQAKYETEKKEQQLSLFRQKNRLNVYVIYGLGIIFILSLLLALLFIKQVKLKGQQQYSMLEQKLLRSQMNPHFIFNFLSAIQNYLMESQPQQAVRYLSSFSKLMRLILENSREEYVSLEKEIQMLTFYLELQQLRFNNEFDYVIEVDDQVECSEIGIPPMFIQPFVENSIEHGFWRLNHKGRIAIKFSIQKDFILFDLRDNGIGLENAKKLKHHQEGHKSLATLITLERISYLNKRNKRKIKFQIQDLKDDQGVTSGTQVIFQIPFKWL